MPDRYEIQDILSQDSGGIRFLAEDRSVGRTVVLHRFFLSDPGAGGFNPDDAETFRTALSRLIEIDHPSLRRVLDGDIDPHDGIPFLVTEPLIGPPLAARIGRQPLEPAAVRSLAESALDLCLKLSHDFGEDRVWVETSPETIEFEEAAGGYAASFGLSPHRWLGDAGQQRGLRPILDLVETAGGWRGRIVAESLGGGLGLWLRQLRQQAETWTLAQARASLRDPGPISAVPGPDRANVPPSPKPARTLWPWLVAGSIGAATAAFIFYQISGSARSPSERNSHLSIAPRKTNAPTTPSQPSGLSTPSPKPLTAAEKASARAAEIAAELAEVIDTPTIRLGPTSPEKNARLIELGRRLRERTGERFKFKTTIYQIRESNSGKTLYVEFGSSAHPDALLARHRVSNGGFTFAELEKFIGQAVQVEGTVVADPSGRIAIDLVGPSYLKPLAE